MKITVNETHTKILTSETHTKILTSEELDLSVVFPGLLEIPSRHPAFTSRKRAMPGRVTGVSLRRTLDLVNPELSGLTTFNIEVVRVKKNGEIANYKTETYSVQRKSGHWASPYWSEAGYTFGPLMAALSKQFDVFDKISNEQ